MRRRAGRGNYKRATIHAILDEGMVAHVGVVGDDGQPFVIPVLYARDGDERLPARLAAQPAARARWPTACRCA